MSLCSPGFIYGNSGNDSFTKLLMHFDTTTGFADSSAFGNSPVATFGSPAIVTSQFKFAAGDSAGAAIKFTPNSALSMNGSSDFAFGTGDFTIDFLLFPNLGGNIQTIYDCRPNVFDGLEYPDIYFNTSNQIAWFDSPSSTDFLVGATSLSIGTTWYHVAFTRSGTILRLFINGILDGINVADNHNYLNPIPSAHKPIIGGVSDLSAFFLDAWVDEFRVSKGIARWTANFVPPVRAYG